MALDPDYLPPADDPPFADEPGETGDDPWRIMGLMPGTSPEELKATYRKLAVQFHPDVLQVLGPDRQRDAARAFIKIKEAYRKIVNSRKK
jgi:preprotein translocase subunit Sec63